MSNGSYKGHRLFSCPEGCALFLPVSHITLRHWSRSNGADAHERVREQDRHRSGSNHPINGHHNNNDRLNQQHRPSSPPQPHTFGILPRTAESVPVTVQSQVHVRGPASPPAFDVGQRVCFPLEDNVYRGEVRFCGLLPGRSSSGIYVGVLLVSTATFTQVQNEDNYYYSLSSLYCQV